MQIICYPREQFLADYHALRARGVAAGTPVVAGLYCSDAATSLLACSPTVTAARRRLWLELAPDLAEAGHPLPDGMDGALYLGQQAELGRARGWLRTDSTEVLPVTCLDLVGPGMERIRLTGHEPAGRQSTHGVDFSRIQGALGEAAWRRLSEFRVALNGAGRLGGALATVLAREGVHQFTLIDGDAMERHNLAGGLVGAVRDIGRPKVEVLARALKTANPACETSALPVSVTAWQAAEGIAAADFVISAVDSDYARLGAAALAALYHKPLLDVGTGIFHTDGRRHIGADLRLVWPGRCLVSAGGLRHDGEARRVLSSARAEQQSTEAPPDWREGRAGSLTSLNAAAAGVAARMLEDFVQGLLTENGAWTRLEFDPDGRLRVSHLRPAVPPSGHCLCSFAGLGDDGIEEVRDWLQTNQSPRPFDPANDRP